MQSYYLRRPLASPKQSHNTIRLNTDSVSRVASKSAISPFQKREGNWAEFTCAKTSGTITRDRGKNWPFRCVPSNSPCNNRGTHFDFSFLIVSKRKLLNSLQPAKASVSPRSSPLGDVSRGGTSATQRHKFHTDDANQCLQNESGSHEVPNINFVQYCVSSGRFW